MIFDHEVTPRSVYIISDRAGVTAGTMSHTLLSQFPKLSFKRHTIPFVDTDDKVKSCVRQINHSNNTHKIRLLIFTSFMDTNFTQELEKSKGIVIGLFKPFIHKLEHYLCSNFSQEAGQAHGINVEHGYMHRIDAINFSMKYDDGVRTGDYNKANLILVFRFINIFTFKPHLNRISSSGIQPGLH